MIGEIVFTRITGKILEESPKLVGRVINNKNISYEPIVCSQWNPSDFVIKYDKGCSDTFSCLKCHGWKEYEFHPKIYKTRPC